MKLFSARISPRLLTALIFGLGAGLWMCFSSALSSHAPSRSEPVADDLFQSTNLLRLAIQVAPGDLDVLRSSHRRNFAPQPKALATVTEDGRVYENVRVHLKGFTSFEPIDELPSLTLKFPAAQKFHGLTKISLNNSVQDRTRLHEKFSRELFAAAGVPVARADHAVVTLNGRALGLYVLTEGGDAHFLARYFQQSDGRLYEGGVLQDIDRPLRLISGKENSPDPLVQQLITASHEPNLGKRFQAVAAAVDLDRFLSMMAVETILCHSDSYSMNRNNYRLYHDPATKKIVFIPHGMDQVLGSHRSGLDLPIVPPAFGMVARALLSTPEGRRLYLHRAGTLFTNLFQSEPLCQRVRQMEAKIAAEKIRFPMDGRWFRGANPRQSQDAEELCARIVRRRAELELQFTDLTNLLAVPPFPKFDTNGVARLNGWNPKRQLRQPEVWSNTELKEDRELLHLRSTSEPVVATVRCRLDLPPGQYRLTGHIHIESASARTNLVSGRLLRYYWPPFLVRQTPFPGGEINLNFQVRPEFAPEEIQLLCEIADESPEVWLDASSLRLIRTQPALIRRHEPWEERTE